MRRAVTLLIVLAVIVGGLALVDHVVKDRVESDIASRIESRDPGSHAKVTITSFPFLGRLLVSGSVPEIQADVTNVVAGDLTFSSIRLTVDDLKVDRNDLFSGKVKPLAIKHGRVVAEITQASVDSLLHQQVVLQPGRIGLDGVDAPVSLTISDGTLGFSVAGLPSLSLKIPVLDVLPCVGSARVVTGALRLTCRFSTLPSVLAGTTFG